MSLGLFLDPDVNLDLDLFLDRSEVMNQPVDNIWLTCVISALAITVNIWAVRVLMTKEDTCITRLVNWDCVSNILISAKTLVFTLNVGFPPNISAICALRNATFISLGTFTRLVPVANVLLRYIMICHPVFFTNCGKEKGIWKWILGSVI